MRMEMPEWALLAMLDDILREEEDWEENELYDAYESDSRESLSLDEDTDFYF